MTIYNSRRSALFGFGSLVVGASAFAAGHSRAEANGQIFAPRARKLPELIEHLRLALAGVTSRPFRWFSSLLISGTMKRSRKSSPMTAIASRYGTTPISRVLAQPDAQLAEYADFLVRARGFFLQSLPRTAQLMSRCSISQSGISTILQPLRTPNSRPTH